MVAVILVSVAISPEAESGILLEDLLTSGVNWGVVLGTALGCSSQVYLA